MVHSLGTHRLTEKQKRAQAAAKQRKLRALHPARYRAAVKKCHDKNKHKHYAAARTKDAERKLFVLAKYGPRGEVRCSWPGCDVVDPDMLSIDHVLDNGYEWRKQNGIGGRRFYIFLAANAKSLSDYQTLCMNHQFKKRADRCRFNRKHNSDFSMLIPTK